MALIQLIYSSTPFGFDDTVLFGILSQARRNNTRDHVTGALICRADIYMQLLEGPEADVRKIYQSISHDNRHDQIFCHVDAPIQERLFPGWAMREDPVRSWMWTQGELARGALLDASTESILGIFRRVAASPA